MQTGIKICYETDVSAHETCTDENITLHLQCRFRKGVVITRI